MPLSDKIKELWTDFFYNEWTEDFFDSFVKRMEESGRPVHRVHPAISALELSPNIRPEDILPEENWRLTIENAKDRIVAPCGCRVLWGDCDHTVQGTCFACFDNDRGRYYIDKHDRDLKELTLEETLDHVRKLEEEGLVHIGVCYCCPDACEILYTLKQKGRWDLLGSSRYVAVVDEEKCVGCKVCVKRCYFDAVDMYTLEETNKPKASVDKKKCMGCGLCIVSCKPRAMRMEVDKPPEHIIPKQKVSMPKDMWGFYDLD